MMITSTFFVEEREGFADGVSRALCSAPLRGPEQENKRFTSRHVVSTTIPTPMYVRIFTDRGS
jgi:hypothetical protein